TPPPTLEAAVYPRRGKPAAVERHASHRPQTAVVHRAALELRAADQHGAVRVRGVDGRVRTDETRIVDLDPGTVGVRLAGKRPGGVRAGAGLEPTILDDHLAI